MRERIDITVPEFELALNDEKRERMRRARAFEAVDRGRIAGMGDTLA